MNRSPLPPQYVNVPSSLVYGDLSAAVIVTGVRIYGLGWHYRYTRTDPIAFADLCALCDIGRSQLYDHLGRLVTAGLLQYTNIGGRFRFTFRQTGISPVFRTDPTVSAAIDPDPEFSGCKQQQQSNLLVPEGGTGGGQAPSGIPDWAERLEILDRIGIREPARSEIATLAHADSAYLQAWAGWYDGQHTVGIGGLLAQLRAAVPAPRVTDYISGKYAEYIQH